MKQITFTILIAMVLLVTTCKKDENGPSTTLPEATQEGKNTMGMKVNSEVWTPYYPCASVVNFCAAGILYRPSLSGQYLLSFHFKRQIGKEHGDLYINQQNSPSITITGLGNKYDSVDVSYEDYLNNYTLMIYNKPFKPKGDFTITKVDTLNKIISGTFGFTLYNGNDSIVITEGRFDYKFDACVCNK